MFLILLLLISFLLTPSNAYLNSVSTAISPTVRYANALTLREKRKESLIFLSATTQVTGIRKKEEKSSKSSVARKQINASKNDYLNGVVRIYCTHSEPNYAMPWQRQRQEFSTSSGFAISQRRILTNAHAVEHGTIIQVKKRQSEKKFLAKVVAIGHQCDLAVLEVEDDSFWSDMPALSFGPLPNLLDEVAVIGYPVGGERFVLYAVILCAIYLNSASLMT